MVSAILSILLTTALIRFICVNKSWRSLITSSSFAYDHVSRSHLRNSLLIKYTGDDNCFYLEKMEVEDTSIVSLRIPRVSVHIPDELKNFNLFGMTYIHGLVLMKDICKGLIVWNVATRRIKEIPLDNDHIGAHFFQPPFYFAENMLGFTVIAGDCDYRIIRIRIFGDDPKRQIAHARVYSRLTGRWTSLSPTSFSGYESISNVKKFAIAKKCSSLVVRGSLHWDCERSAFLALNLENWIFLNLGWPQFEMLEILASVTLTEVNGCLGLIAGRRLSQYFEIWTHSELGWVKRYLVQPPNKPLKNFYLLGN